MVNSNTYQQNALEGFFQFSTIDQDRRKDAFKEGAYQSKCETAKKAKSLSIPIDQISIMTGLTQEEILKL